MNLCLHWFSCVHIVFFLSFLFSMSLIMVLNCGPQYKWFWCLRNSTITAFFAFCRNIKVCNVTAFAATVWNHEFDHWQKWNFRRKVFLCCVIGKIESVKKLCQAIKPGGIICFLSFCFLFAVMSYKVWFISLLLFVFFSVSSYWIFCFFFIEMKFA